VKYVLIGAVALMLVGCSDPDPNAPKPQPFVKRTFEIDGCEVKYVDHPNLPNFYIARCGNTVTNTWQQRSGKTTTTRASINVDSADELRKQLEVIETRNKALAKLSAEEKKALGLSNDH